MSKEYKPIYKNDIRLNDSNGVRRLLTKVANALIQDEIEEDRARALVYISNTILASIKQGDIENRISELETLINKKGI